MTHPLCICGHRLLRHGPNGACEELAVEDGGIGRCPCRAYRTVEQAAEMTKAPPEPRPLHEHQREIIMTTIEAMRAMADGPMPDIREYLAVAGDDGGGHVEVPVGTIEAVRARLGDAVLLRLRTLTRLTTEQAYQSKNVRAWVRDHDLQRARADRLALALRVVHELLTGTQGAEESSRFGMLGLIRRAVEKVREDWKA